MAFRISGDAGCLTHRLAGNVQFQVLVSDIQLYIRRFERSLFCLRGLCGRLGCRVSAASLRRQRREQEHADAQHDAKHQQGNQNCGTLHVMSLPFKKERPTEIYTVDFELADSMPFLGTGSTDLPTKKPIYYETIRISTYLNESVTTTST